MYEIKLYFQGLFLRQGSMSRECGVVGSSLNPVSLALLLAPSLPGMLSSRWLAQCYQGRVTSGVQGHLSVLAEVRNSKGQGSRQVPTSKVRGLEGVLVHRAVYCVERLID